MNGRAGSECAGGVPVKSSEHVDFAVLVGKHADVGFVIAPLHPFRKETKFLKLYGWGGPISIVDGKFAAD
jgi:hypothetical protein